MIERDDRPVVNPTTDISAAPVTETAVADPSVAPSATANEATGQDQEEYERALSELGDVLYNNEQASDALLAMIQPENKVDTTVKTVISLITQIDRKIDLEESTIWAITMQAVDRLIDMAEAKDVTFSERETEQVAMAAWEGIMGMFGGDESMEESYSFLSQNMSDVEIKQGQAKYEELKGG